MVFDPSDDDILLFGGIGAEGQLLGELGWFYYKTSVMPEADSAEAAIPTMMVPSPAPVGRFGASLAYDPVHQYALLFGGCLDTAMGTCRPLSAASDTWTFYNGTWHWVCTGCGPSARWGASLAYDQKDGYFLLVGGCVASSGVCTHAAVKGDYWKYTPSGGWTSLGTFSGNARGDASIAYDSSDQLVVLYGGIGCTGVCGDSWTYATGTWTSVTVPTSLGARFGAAMAYYQGTGGPYILLFGGQGSAGTVHADSWKFTHSAGWTAITTTTSPPARWDAAVAYDPTDNCVVLFGGANATGVPLNDSWKYSGTWSRLSSGPLPAVTARWGAAMVYDPNDGPAGFTLLFGGSVSDAIAPGGGNEDGGGGQGQGDTWVFDEQPATSMGPYWIEVSPYT
ncbi:MAG: kelch motif-containing protein [Thermoplasmata archaeon]|nr:kelch motif-containing protein [Thermoplasmata archaeon]